MYTYRSDHYSYNLGLCQYNEIIQVTEAELSLNPLNHFFYPDCKNEQTYKNQTGMWLLLGEKDKAHHTRNVQDRVSNCRIDLYIPQPLIITQSR